MANSGRIDIGADLDAKLLRAAAVGSVELVERFLDRGADPNLANRHHITAFEIAMAKGHFLVARALFIKGYRPEVLERDELLVMAAAHGDTGLVEFLLESGVSIEAVSGAEQVTPLIAASVTGFDETVASSRGISETDGMAGRSDGCTLAQAQALGATIGSTR